MIKIIIIGVACFVLALAASTGVVVMRTPPKVAAADSTAVADSTLHGAAAAGHAAVNEHGEVEPTADPGAAEHGEPDRMALAAAVPHEAEVVHGAKPAEPADEASDYGRVAKILVNMKPAEAAAILSHLGDAQVEGVLRSVGPRQAATLLAAMPTERAAQLSRRLLVIPPAQEKR